MSVADHEAAQRLLAQYDALEPDREHLQDLYDAANAGEGSYSAADELSADINEVLRDLADQAMEILRRVTFE